MRKPAITKTEQPSRMSGVGIKIAVITLMLGQVILITAPCPVSAQQSYEAYYNYLGNDPKNESTIWSQDAQGVAHDRENWFITQTLRLWKIPVNYDLASVSGNDAGVIVNELNPPVSQFQDLLDDGYDHFGDLEWCEFEGQGYLIVPVEGKDNPEVGAIAIFSADNLDYMHHDYLMDGKNFVQSRAAWCAVDPQGFVYSSGRDVGFINKYRIKWDSLKTKERPWVEKVASISLLSEDGSQVNITYLQGGAISPSGELLYLVAGYHSGSDPSWGIHVFNLRTGRRVQRSQNGSGYFNYEFHPGLGILEAKKEEPEGLTIWNLNDFGELHVLMLNNDSPKYLSGVDEIYFKHYTGTIYVDHAYIFFLPSGTPGNPFKTVSEANTLAWDGAQIKIAAGSYPEKLVFSKRIRIVADKGPVIIGQ